MQAQRLAQKGELSYEEIVHLTTIRSPSPWSKTISGGQRLSEQASTTAIGVCSSYSCHAENNFVRSHASGIMRCSTEQFLMKGGSVLRMAHVSESEAQMCAETYIFK